MLAGAKGKDQLYISLLVSLWRISTQTDSYLAEIMNETINKEIKIILVLEKRYSNALTT